MPLQLKEPSPAALKIMKANKSKNTGPEMILRRELWRNNLRGYRVHYAKLPGKPDIAYPTKKVAILVHGCFWHRCLICNQKIPKNNREFWIQKFEATRKRDTNTISSIEQMGWACMVIWECQVKNELDRIIDRLKPVLE